MTYFLGRDMNAYITTESTLGLHFSGTTASTVGTGAAGYTTFAEALASGIVTAGTHDLFGNLVVDLTGCDLSIGAVDEDVTYFGLRAVQKVEAKKETTVTLTRKKIDKYTFKIKKGIGSLFHFQFRLDSDIARPIVFFPLK